jgi:hypothetical protein
MGHDFEALSGRIIEAAIAVRSRQIAKSRRNESTKGPIDVLLRVFVPSTFRD